MKKQILAFIAALVTTASIGALAQVSGGGVEGGGGQPSGNAFSVQYKNGNRFGGTGPGTSGQVLTSRGAGLSPTFQDATGGGSTVPTTTQGDTLYASATNVLSALAKDTNSTRYLANTGTNNNPAWSQINLANGVTGTLPVANGGTNVTTALDDRVLIGDSTTWQSKAVPDCTDTAGNHLNYTASTNTLSCGTSNGASTGTFTATFQTGFTADVTQNFTWSKVGSVVVLRMTSSLTGTSDSTSTATTGTDLPAAIRPAANLIVSTTIGGTDNGTGISVCYQLNSAGTIAYGVAAPTTSTCSMSGWTASGTKTVSGSATSLRTVTYSVD